MTSTQLPLVNIDPVAAAAGTIDQQSSRSMDGWLELWTHRQMDHSLLFHLIDPRLIYHWNVPFVVKSSAERQAIYQPGEWMYRLTKDDVHQKIERQSAVGGFVDGSQHESSRVAVSNIRKLKGSTHLLPFRRTRSECQSSLLYIGNGKLRRPRRAPRIVLPEYGSLSQLN